MSSEKSIHWDDLTEIFSAGGATTDNQTSSGQHSVAQGLVGYVASPVQPSSGGIKQPSSFSSANFKPKGNLCSRCSKPVYFAEEIKAAGQCFHKLCYRCTHCKKSINGASYSEHEGNLYDDNCYRRLFGPKGVGFGIGAGALSTGN